MKKTLLTSALLIICFWVRANPVHRIELENGINIGIEACSEEIFRIKIVSGKDFGESLMERYGILKTDWPEVRTTEKTNGRKWSLTTDRACVEINRKTGLITFKDKAGRVIIQELAFITAENPLCEKLAAAINDKFENLHVVSNGGIIGDDNGTISEKDKTESGDPAKSSIISISLEKGERFYGGGSTSREHIQHRGELLRMWTTYQHTEIPMPFMMSSRGWGIFNNTTRKNYFDVGNFDKDRLNIYTTYEKSDFYIIIGNDMPSVLDKYTQITGRTYILPKWAYGLCFGPNMLENQFDILRDAVSFRQSGVPCDVFWLEPQWMEKRYDFSTNKKWNYDKFSPEPYWLKNQYPKKYHERLFIGKLRGMGFHLGLWLCEEYDTSIAEEDAIASRNGKKTSGKEHWMDHLKNFLDQGVEGFKFDPARTIDEHTFRKYYNGKTDKEMHNLNQILLPKQMYMMSREHTGKRTWHHYTAGWSGTPHWTASTSGDNGGGKTALFDQLNLGMSGYMNTSCDVMSVKKSLEMQSLHFGMFLPWVQINSWFSFLHPFYYSEKEQVIYKDYVKLRYRLIPYIYSTALEGTMNGMPMVRSMPLVFPEDRNVDDMVYQYMFGNSLCVSIFSNDIYLPEGTWTNAWTGETIVSKGEKFSIDYPEDKAGLLFIREGAIIPCQKDVQYIGTQPIQEFIIKVFPNGNNSYTMYEDDGESYEYEKGAIAATKFECSKGKNSIQFIINPVQGRFEGIPQHRDYTLEIKSDRRPAKVLLNNNEQSEWTYDTDNKIRFNVNSLDIREKAKIYIEY